MKRSGNAKLLKIFNMGELTKRDIGFYLLEDIYKLDEEKGSGIGVNFQGVNYSFKDVVVEVEKNYTDGEQIMAAAKAVAKVKKEKEEKEDA